MSATLRPGAFDPVVFAHRHIGPSADDMSAMLKTVGVADMAELMAQAVPQTIRQRQTLDVGSALSETEAIAALRTIAAKNAVLTSMIGQGYYGTILPPVIQRNILENPAWYTAYTPYQPEISQGRLEALLNFQTMIADLTGLDIANASLLDEATAAAEAMAMAQRVAMSKVTAFFVDADCHPQTIAVVRTRAEPLGRQIVVGDPLTNLDATAVFGALLQYPGSSGEIRDFRPAIAALHAAGALAVIAADPLALTLLTPPGELGADIAVGSAQRFGVPMGYGGPHAAYIATRDKHKRALPGRLVGVSVDTRGRRAYRLALQTREQHIRREKATSNICTAQVLLAVIASMYGVYHGPDGLRQIAGQVHTRTAALADGLKALGWRVQQTAFFDTITIEAGDHQAEIVQRAAASGVNLWRIAGSNQIGVSCDETTTPETIEAVWRSFGHRPGGSASAERSTELSYTNVARQSASAIPAALSRRSAFMMHPVFHQHRSETEMLRYMRRLADRDLALDRSMIPLGSCTMKLNATAEMLPVTWPEFSDLHPFAPADQAKGYAGLLGDLAAKLCAITGYDAVSLQPNSGAQGEYAGLLAIRAYHRSRGDLERNICLVPSSAHGTNPASAHMAGMDVVVVGCDQDGNVDLADLRAKAERHAARLAAIMVTYPSTHGVFEAAIREICDVVHTHGGQVYLDGANLNAMVGLARPGEFGADVSHINLHKTFCIPHGGGGPGMGPIGVKAHLIPFLPGHPGRTGEAAAVGPVSAAPFGSASILPISWMYIAMMGSDGLTAATCAAILNANYIAKRLEGHFALLYKGPHGRIAHECIIDTRPFKDSAGVSVEDIAKRLIDYGFHAPTMSFPVAGTLMIEPTESESKAELDRFCDAMIAIRAEIRAIEEGRMGAKNNPLRNAPHTAFDLMEDDWRRPYRRQEACFPVTSLLTDKYWCPVNRIDNVYGDRHLVCTCPPVEEYDTAAE
ncbi:MAG: aminomethyl-transferring glycine dehydrogenase [Rhizobiales bacterium]|nr:aminomethyl-transferring glycine dehydrogenase [Hyphomicrobiales bacterium]